MSAHAEQRPEPDAPFRNTTEPLFFSPPEEADDPEPP